MARSQLTLALDLKTLIGDQLGEPLSDLPRPEQRDAFCSESLLGDPHQLSERSIPGGLAEEIDRASGLSESHSAFEVVHDAALTRRPTADRRTSTPMFTALDRRPPKLLSETSESPLVSSGGPLPEELLPGTRVRVDANRAPPLDCRLKPPLSELPLERERLVQAALVPAWDGQRGNGVMFRLEMLPMRRSGGLDSTRRRLADLRSMNPRGGERLLVLAPKPVVPSAFKRTFYVGVHLLARHLGGVRTWNELPVSLTEPLLGPPAAWPPTPCTPNASWSHPRLRAHCRVAPNRPQTA